MDLVKGGFLNVPLLRSQFFFFFFYDNSVKKVLKDSRIDRRLTSRIFSF